jgi:hypothetical protein
MAGAPQTRTRRGPACRFSAVASGMLRSAWQGRGGRPMRQHRRLTRTQPGARRAPRSRPRNSARRSRACRCRGCPPPALRRTHGRDGVRRRPSCGRPRSAASRVPTSSPQPGPRPSRRSPWEVPGGAGCPGSAATAAGSSTARRTPRSCPDPAAETQQKHSGTPARPQSPRRRTPRSRATGRCAGPSPPACDRTW